ncbi:MAG TPA: DUF5990 family protein [Caulobacteraceae bacterium]|nr:DUF5990 family protein [Caulobacteraceae bacterium]
MSRIEVPIRAVIENPPPGVRWAYQRSKGDLSDLADPVAASPDRLTFEFSLQVELLPKGVRWLGPGVQGPPDKRFFYLNCGTMAGDPESCFTRRAKVSLMSIGAAMIERLKPGQRLEVRFAGMNRKGEPACATITFSPPGWTIA